MKETSKVRWSIDRAHSEISFRVRHLMISNLKGSFTEFDASIFTTEKDFTTAEVHCWITASSINTRDSTRDRHLMSSDFLDVGKYKLITFISSTMGMPDAYGNIELWGELTMMGISKNIRLNVLFGGIAKDPWGNERVGFNVSGSINRADWGLTWNTVLGSGGFLIGDEIKISCDVELIKNHDKARSLKINSITSKNNRVTSFIDPKRKEINT